MNAYELWAVVTGLVAEGKINPIQVPDDAAVSPWGAALKLLKKHPETIGNKSKVDEMLSSALLAQQLEEAHYHASKYNGLGEQGVFAWLDSAKSASKKYQLANLLKSLANRCEMNEDVSSQLIKAREAIDGVLTCGISGLRPANEYKYKDYIPYKPSGIKWVDNIIGGWPSDGLIVVIAPEFTGKSYLGFYAACKFAAQYPELPPPAIYTLEMPAENYIKRSLHAYPQFQELVDAGRILVSSTIDNVSELAAEISTRDVPFVVVDHVGYLVGSDDASEYSKVYKTLVGVQRHKAIPIMALVQTNRENKKMGGFLDKWSAGWSGEAEQSAALLLTLNKYDPNIESSDDSRFPTTEDNPHPKCANRQVTPRFFVCVWKDRNAEMKNNMSGGDMGIGAIRIEPNQITGYYDQLWEGEAYGNRLWFPNAHKRRAPVPPINPPSTANAGTVKRKATIEDAIGD